MTVIGEAATGTDAVRQAKQFKPDIVIMDISMPDQNGIDSTRQILKSVGVRVLILTVHLEYQMISDALAVGAAGYLAKDSLDNELVAAVRTIKQGGSVFSAIVSKRLVESQIGSAGPQSLEALTPREREVFILLAEGKSPTKAANSLYVSPKTIHTHRQHILEKLGLHTTTDLIRFALRHGLIKP